MRKIYSYFDLVWAVFIVVIALGSCSKNHEDIAAPTIIFLEPTANDTIQIIDHVITIKVKAVNNNFISFMKMYVIKELGAAIYPYDKYGIDSQSYTCDEKFYMYGITKTTRMKLIVVFQNVYHNRNEEEIYFYVKP